MATDEWYMRMAAAMSRRSHAQTMVSRWQEKVQAAEEEIQQLRTEQEPAAEAPVEQAQV